MSKKCSSCKIDKEESEFDRRSNRKRGYKSKCKKCSKEVAVYKAKNIRDYHLKKKYGISLEEYEILYSSQKGECAICSEGFPLLYVDHCHVENKIRGLLCMKCNTALGLFRDDISIMKKAIKYVRKNEKELDKQSDKTSRSTSRISSCS